MFVRLLYVTSSYVQKKIKITDVPTLGTIFVKDSKFLPTILV